MEGIIIVQKCFMKIKIFPPADDIIFSGKIDIEYILDLFFK